MAWDLAKGAGGEQENQLSTGPLEIPSIALCVFIIIFFGLYVIYYYICTSYIYLYLIIDRETNKTKNTNTNTYKYNFVKCSSLFIVVNFVLFIDLSFAI